MRMQAAAVNVLLTELNGKQGECLRPVPNQYKHMDYTPGHIIVKTKVQCLSPCYEASTFTFSNVMSRATDLPMRDTKLILEKFTKTQETELRGLVDVTVKDLFLQSKILSNEFGFNVNGSDKVKITVSDVDLEKVEIDLHKLCDMNLGPVNMRCPLISQAQKFMEKRRLLFLKRKKVLCLVVGCVRAVNDFTVTTHINKNIGEEVDTKVDTLGPDLDLKQTTTHVRSSDKSAIIKRGTILAYEIREMQVEEDGALEILVSADGRGKLRRRSKNSSLETSPGSLTSSCSCVDLGVPSVVQEIMDDDALRAIRRASSDEKKNIRRAILTGLQIGDPASLINAEVNPLAAVEIEDDLETDSESVPMKPLTKFIMKDEKFRPGPDDRLDERTDARASGLTVLSEAVSGLPDDVTESIVSATSEGGAEVADTLRDLLDKGSITSMSRELAPLARKLSCKVTENASGVMQIEKPENAEILVNAFVVADCLQTEKTDREALTPITVAEAEACIE